MEHRRLGRSGLACAPLALGCHVFGWTADAAASGAILDAFVDRGFSLLDTADTYSTWVPGHSGGESETIIGDWLKATGKRDRVLIATKVGGAMPDVGKGLSRAHIIRSAEDSLRRLRTDRIDLYQAHFDDTATPFEETLEAFATLIQSGKVRAIGASNYSAPRLAEALAAARAHGLPLFSCLQPHYNLVTRAYYEGDLRRLCLEEELGVIPFRALEAGFLTGKYRSMEDTVGAARGAVVAGILDERSLDILRELDRAAAQFRATPAQIAVAWLLAQPGVTAPIVSVTSVAQLTEIFGALTLTLDARTLMRLDMVSA
ncbi:aldo/keto reductase [Methylosinus sporium]|uniref:Alcohol dehydrogenase n=1 Tax=Methylosinus sporium TaxID=428 RepID=A0A2U1SPU2_METSR|nr:aldo/keto reductase [Methylosinus sporium]PWB93637.1 alcohol dehydrogenase [Methylosinus sporium]